MGNLGNRTEVRLVGNEKDYLIWTSKHSYISQKMFENNLIAISKKKLQ